MIGNKVIKKVEIFHDFNKLYHSDVNGQSIAPLICYGTVEQIKNENIVLVKGLQVMLIQPDDVDVHGNPDRLEVDAPVRYDNENNCWVAVFKRDELMYRSDK